VLAPNIPVVGAAVFPNVLVLCAGAADPNTLFVGAAAGVVPNVVFAVPNVFVADGVAPNVVAGCVAPNVVAGCVAPNVVAGCDAPNVVVGCEEPNVVVGCDVPNAVFGCVAPNVGAAAAAVPAVADEPNENGVCVCGFEALNENAVMRWGV